MVWAIWAINTLRYDVLLAEGGHDSLEDAVSCMDLMKWKVKEDIKKEVRQMAHAQQQVQV